MRHHQKYFSVESADGKLAPEFVAVMNTSSVEGLVKQVTSVCCGRVSTMAGFWRRIRKKLADRVADLANVTFQAKLGSYLAKTERVVELVKQLGGDEHAQRAARLARLTSQRNWSKNSRNCRASSAVCAQAQGEPGRLAGDLRSLQTGKHGRRDSARAGQLVSLADG